MSAIHEVAEKIADYYQPDDPAHAGDKASAFESARRYVADELQQDANAAKEMTLEEFLRFAKGQT